MNTETAPELEAKPGTPGCRVWRWAAYAFLGLLLLPPTLWAIAALHFDVRIPSLRTPLALLYALSLLVIWIRAKKIWPKVLLTVTAFGIVLAWWLTLKPSNTRDWQSDLATLAYAEINGNQITVHNIRNCDYRTETDFDVRYYDKTFDLSRLRSADFYMVYWGSPYMAHTMISFGFEGGDYLCFSIETRKEKGEGYSAIKGLFRQFELIYIVADERDLVRLRTNYRQGEDAYVFRLQAPQEQVRSLLMEYLERINSLRQRPEWYSAITQNCTTSIRMQRKASERAPWDWRMLVNGYGDTLLYERGTIPTNLPLAELKQKSHINARAKAADKAADFSRQIRSGIPGME